MVGGCASPPTPSSSRLTGPPASSGPTATVPDVTGDPVSQAVQTLQADGFDPGDTGLSPTSIVKSTDPAAGTYSGGNAYISISATAPTTTTTTVLSATVIVPNVAGETISAATKAMSAVDLTMDSSAAYPTNVIAYTVPAAGTTVAEGTAIQEYSCGAGSTPTPSPAGLWSCNPGDYGPTWGGQ